jgi:SAM-dependent methyltransferase
MKKHTSSDHLTSSNLADNNLSEVKLSYLKKFLQGKSILDVGAGKCFYSQWLHKQNDSLDITAIDYIDLDKIPSDIGYLKLNLEALLPFQDEAFDTILAFDIIEHIENESQLISELSRVCKKNGVLIGSAPHDNDKFLPTYNLTFYHRSDLTHKRYYTPETISQKFCSSGFKICTIDAGGGVNPQFIAEFFPRSMRFLVKKSIGLCRRMGIVNTNILKSDLFFVAQKGNL